MSTVTNQLDIELIGAQEDLWDAFFKSKKNVLAVAHVGSGKSFLCRLLLPIAATTPAIHKGRDIVYVAPSNGMVSRIMWSELKKDCIKHYGLTDEKDINNSNKTITFANGIKIVCLSAETGLKGMNASLVICDEAAEFSDESLQELSNRIRPKVGDPDSGGRMILISTPEGKNHFYKMFQTALSHPEDWIVFHLPYQKMKSQTKKWVETQRYLLSPLKFARDIECDWGSVEDQFYYTWNKSMLVAETKDRGGDLYSFNDFNKNVMNAIVAQVVGEPYSQSGKLEILNTYSVKNCGSEMIAKIIREDYPMREIKAIIDMSGSDVNRDTSSPFGVTDRTNLEKYGFVIQNTKRGMPRIGDTDNSSNAFINQRRLIVPMHLEKLISAIETFHYEDGTRKALVKYKDIDSKHIDGLGDCLRYGIHHLFPMRHGEDVTQPRSFSDDETYYEEPGSQYFVKPASKTKNGMPTVKSLLNKYNEDDSEEESWC